MILIIDDCHWLDRAFNDVSFYYIPRSCNRVAHSITTLAQLLNVSVPVEMFRVNFTSEHCRDIQSAGDHGDQGRAEKGFKNSKNLYSGEYSCIIRKSEIQIKGRVGAGHAVEEK